MAAFVIAEAADAAAVAACRALFVEYQRALGVDLCFQDFDRELASLPGAYSHPAGRLFLATIEGEPAGCVALRPLAGGDCEMKRLYVRPAARGTGLGRALCRAVIDAARDLGYTRIRLDTLPGMAGAQALYASLGFRDTAPYTHNPVPGARFMALALSASGS